MNNEPATTELQKSLSAMVFELHEELGKRLVRSSMGAVRRVIRAKSASIAEREIRSLRGYAAVALFQRAFKRTMGFEVGFTTACCPPNRYGKEKPWPFWLEHGTEERSTKGFTRATGFRTAHATGRIRPVKSLETADKEIGTNAIDSLFLTEMEKKAERIIRKYV